MTYTPKNFEYLLGSSGFSEHLLQNHFTLYGGYVTNTNKLAEILQKTETGTPEYAELHRRFGWEWNGMRLHELYFENLGKQSTEAQSAKLQQQLTQDFGSSANWEKDFRAVGALRGIGWVILSYDLVAGRLFNTWINEHDAGHLAGTAPLLVLDVFEHAFLLDYGLKRADYVAAFFAAIDWAAVNQRFESVTQMQ